MKQKMHRIVPILALLASTVCIGQAMPYENKTDDICREAVDLMSDDCLDISYSQLEKKLNAKYAELLKRAKSHDPKLHGLSQQYFLEIRKKWEVYQEQICSDPTVTTDLRTPADRYIGICRVEQLQYHLKSLERF